MFTRLVAAIKMTSLAAYGVPMSPLTRLIIGGLIGSMTRKGDQGPNRYEKEKAHLKTLPEILHGDNTDIPGKGGGGAYTGDFPAGFGHAHEDVA